MSKGESAVHVPKAETTTLAVTPFADALQQEADGSLAYDRARWLYVPNAYTEYRYLLGTRGENPLICIGVNPSTARPDALDPTLQSVERIAKANGYDSFVMVNVYAQRATDPKTMDVDFNEFLHRQNLEGFRWLLDRSQGRPAVWAAWGAVVEQRPYLKRCAADLIAAGRERDAAWLHAGALSKAGHPHHPLYLRADAALEPFDAEGYLAVLKNL